MRTRCFAALAAACLPVVVAAQLERPEIEIVALTNTPAADGVGTIATIEHLYGIDWPGRVWYGVGLTGSGTSDDWALHYGSQFSTTQALRSERATELGMVDALPNAMETSRHRSSYWQSFLAELAGEGRRTLVWTDRGRPLQRIAGEGDPTPEGSGFFGRFTDSRWGVYGKQVLLAELEDESGAAVGSGWYQAFSYGATERLVRTGDVAPNGGSVISRFVTRHRWATDGVEYLDDELAFTAELLDPNTLSAVGTGIYTVDEWTKELTEVVRSGAGAPGGATLLRPLLADAASDHTSGGRGAICAFAVVSEIGTAAGELGLFTVLDGQLTEVVRVGDPAPDGNGVFSLKNTTSGAEIGGFESVRINWMNELVFAGLLSDRASGPVAPGDQRAIFLQEPNAPLVTLFREGNPTPDGLGTIITLGGMSGIITGFNNRGQLLVEASIEEAGAVVKVLYYLDGLRNVREIVRSGAALDGSTITELSAWPDGAFLSPSRQVAFRFELADGRAGIAIWTQPIGQDCTDGTAHATLEIADGDALGLFAAIEFANDEASRPGCDVISLAPDGHYNLEEIIVEVDSPITILGNNATLEAGNGLYVRAGGQLFLQDVSLISTRGLAVSPDELDPRDAFCRLERCRISNSVFFGGIRTDRHGVAHISDCDVSGNVGLGSAIHAGPGTLVVRTTIAGNNGAFDSGGGVSGAGTLINCTLADNTQPRSYPASSGGTWIHCTISNTSCSTSAALSSATLDHCLVIAPDCNDVGVTNFVDNGYNLIQGSAELAHPMSSAADPRVTSLGDYGGFGLTHMLLCDSPAINAGGRVDIAMDQRGIARPYGGAPDIGAVEASDCFEPCLVPSSIPDGDVAALRAALACAGRMLGEDEIALAPGGFYQLRDVDNLRDGPNGLPSLQDTLLLRGNGATIARSTDPNTPAFRILHIANNALVEDLTIANGQTERGGGVFVGSYSTRAVEPQSDARRYAFLQRCLIRDNQGGGIYGIGHVVIANSTIHDNTSNDHAAGLYDSVAWNCTITSNGSSDGSPGIQVDRGFLIGNIIADGLPGAVDVVGSTDVGHNLIEDGSGLFHEDSFAADPLLGPLADNGGPSWTRALLPGSPAIDATGYDCSFFGPTDQRGAARPLGSSCDLGAYEAPCAGDIDANGDVSITDLLQLLSSFGARGLGLPGDLNADGSVNLTDLSILLLNFAAPC